jgi:glycosyltransferase involved in cell wall biosynthesis
VTGSDVGPDVAVIMPAHNAARWIGAAIQSVLAGADRLAELVVADDGSTDETAAIARSYGARVRVVSLPGGPFGQAAGRNAAVAASTSPYLVIMDADDLWAAGRPDPRLVVLDARPEVGVASGAVQPFTDEGPFGPPRPGPIAVSSITRRSVYEALGGMTESLRWGEDIDFLLRAREAGFEVVAVPEVTVLYRLRPDQLSRDRTATNHGLLSVVHASLQRRRAGQGDA